MNLRRFLAPALALLASCSGPVQVGEETSPVFVNGDFESGTAGTAPSGWTVNTYTNQTGVTIQSPQTRAGLNLSAHNTRTCSAVNTCTSNFAGNACTGGFCSPTMLTTEIAKTNQPDPSLGSTATLRVCRYGAQCALVNNQGLDENVNSLSQTMTLAAADIDPNDMKYHVRLVVAPVLQDPGHSSDQQPFFFVQVTNVTQGTTLYSNFNFSNQSGVPWQVITSGGNTMRYTNWQLIDVTESAGSMRLGDQVNLEVIAAGCEPGGHWGQVYVDGVGSAIPGLYLSGSAPIQVNNGSSLVYTVTYNNGSSAAESGVVIHFVIPTGTTYQSSTVPAGFTCTTPAVGSTGTTVTCTATGTIAPATPGSFTVTTTVTAAQGSTVTQGNYDISSSTESTLLGNVLLTYVGCTADAQCTAGFWCKESTKTCTATVANGTMVPSDPGHNETTLNGTCTAAAGTLTCTSAVCDTDNLCGFKNGDGTCSSTNAATVCRSAICDTDGKCGYANGDGPCTSTNGSAVCRSGICSASGKCLASGTCNLDADCTTGSWCNETTHACVATASNGNAVGKDTAHSETTLDGSCTTAAGTLTCTSKVCDTKDSKCGFANSDGTCSSANATTVCRSGICDTDNMCGYLDGDGPCNPLNATTVCRSGVCSVNFKCQPLGGCNVDLDCNTATQWCNESMHACTAKLSNGTDIPTDPPHTNPTLNKMCTTQAGATVCSSSVCDTDNKCGYANADGPCSVVTQTKVCRSSVCDIDGRCGYLNGDGPCTSTNGATVCRSGVCSDNGLCLAPGTCNDDKDCTGGQWCLESTHTCTDKLANAVKIPNDPTHTSPTLDAMCTTGAAMLVCVSGVCDTSDNECGYADGDGTCDSTTAATVCRSTKCSADGKCLAPMTCHLDADCTGGQWCNETLQVCTDQLANGVAIPTDSPHVNPTLNMTCTADAATLVCLSGVCDTKDAKCGFADGDGSCTSVTAAVVCRSGLCSADNRCVGASGCHLDADCSNGQWCNETLQLCTNKLMNGTMLPNDPPHTSPTLDAMCMTDAAMLVCQSGVCDTNDNECGYANGDGPCTSANATTVCRSGVCGSNGVCVAAMGCNVDADCMNGLWCNETTHMCAAKLANGTPLPTDTPHSNPTLDGTCTSAAATLVCTSAVCDTKDNECGYADGDGPCTSDNGGTVCRSGLCSTNGTCLPSTGCNTDADCKEPGKPMCDTQAHTCVAGTVVTHDDGGLTLNGGGGGGCSAAGHNGGDGILAVFALLGLLLLGGRRRLVPFVVALLLSLSGVAGAQTQARGAAIDVFHPSAAGSDWFTLDSMDYRGKLRAAVSATLDYAHDPLVVYQDGKRVTAPVRHQGFVDIGASFTLFERLRLQAMLPIAFYQSGTPIVVDGVQAHPNHKGGLGDLRLGADVRLWGTYGHPFSISLGGLVTFPTGSRIADFGNGNVTGDVHVAVAGDISVFTYAANIGFAFRRDQIIANVRFNDEVQFAAAVGVRLVKKHLLIGPEFYGMGDVGSSAGHSRKGDLEGDLGAHWNFDSGLRVGAGVGTGLVKSAGVPDVRVLANVGWMMPYHDKKKAPVDTDHDGIFDPEDACPTVPGVRSELASRNGCPGDRDHDGVLDIDDLCPDVPQGEHPDPRKVGCPDRDTDGDGVYDSNDQCFDVAQGEHPDPKRIGCPDKDTDGDGVYDSNDQCVDVPQGEAPDPKRIGCPLPDRDGDRIADDVDACPDKPGAPSTNPKKNGCPGLVTITNNKIAILKPVLFATDKDVILVTSFPVLEAVAETLRSVPDIKHVSIQGHTDSQGKPAHNLDLSERRAQSCMKWLVSHGIDASRLDAKGFGQTQPLADNRISAGRAKNRRVDFVITPDKVPVQP